LYKIASTAKLANCFLLHAYANPRAEAATFSCISTTKT